MFICAATGRRSLPNESACRLVTHIRTKTYFSKPKRRRFNKFEGDEGMIKSAPIVSEHPEISGHGHEVVREILVCRDYYVQKMAEGFKPTVVHSND